MKPGTQVTLFGGQLAKLISNNDDGTCTVECNGSTFTTSGMSLTPGPDEKVTAPKKMFPPLVEAEASKVVDDLASELTGAIVRDAIRQADPDLGELMEPEPVELINPTPVDLIEPTPVELIEPTPVDLAEEPGSGLEDDWA